MAQWVKETACNAGDVGSIPGSGRSPGEGNGNQLWYSCLKNPMDKGAWQATVQRIAKSWTQLSKTFCLWNPDIVPPTAEILLASSVKSNPLTPMLPAPATTHCPGG